MERVVRVDSLELRDLVPLFSPEGYAWVWAMRGGFHELVADERWDLNLPFIETVLERSGRGWTMSFEELEQFGRTVRQVIWGEFVAAKTDATLPWRTATPTDVGRNAIAGLAAFDGEYWLVGGPAAVIDRVVPAFPDVEELSPDDWAEVGD